MTCSATCWCLHQRIRGRLTPCDADSKLRHSLESEEWSEDTSMSVKQGDPTLAAESKCPVSHIGSSFDPFDGDPYDFYAVARREEPIFYNPQIDYWVVTRYNDVREIFLDSATFSAGVALELIKPLCPAAAQVVVDSGLRFNPAMVDQDPPSIPATASCGASPLPRRRSASWSRASGRW